MIATISRPSSRRSKFAVQVVGTVAALGMVTGCVTNDSGGPSNQTTGTFLGAALGGTVGGLAFGSAGGAVGGALVGALAEHAPDPPAFSQKPREEAAPKFPGFCRRVRRV